MRPEKIVAIIFLLKNPTIIANIAAKILGLLSKSTIPALSKKIGGKIIAGKIAAGTKDNIFFALSFNISFLSKKIIENLVTNVIIPA